MSNENELIGVTFHYADGEEVHVEGGVIAVIVNIQEHDIQEGEFEGYIQDIQIVNTNDIDIDETKDIVNYVNEQLQSGNFESEFE